MDRTTTEPNWCEVFTPIVDDHKIRQAHELWISVLSDMTDRNIFAPVNAAQVKRYVLASVLYTEVTEGIMSTGHSVGTPGSQKHRRHPLLGFALSLDAVCSAHEESLGLSVKTRHKAKPIASKPIRSRAANEFLSDKIVSIRPKAD